MAGARLLAGHWLAWLAIVRDVAVEPMVRFRFFFFYFKQPSKLGLGPGLGQVVTWVRLVRVVAVTRALALRFFCRRPTSLSPGKPDGSGRSCFRAPIQRGADGPHSVNKNQTPSRFLKKLLSK